MTPKEPQPWTLKIDYRAFANNISCEQVQWGRTVNTALHRVHWTRQMVTPPRRRHIEWE